MVALPVYVHRFVVGRSKNGDVRAIDATDAERFLPKLVEAFCLSKSVLPRVWPRNILLLLGVQELCYLEDRTTNSGLTHALEVPNDEVVSPRRGGGGGSYRNFRSGSKLLQGPGQINKQNKLQTAVGGGGGVRSPPKENLYPRMSMLL